jgi:hypothetical protein
MRFRGTHVATRGHLLEGLQRLALDSVSHTSHYEIRMVSNLGRDFDARLAAHRPARKDTPISQHN